MEEERILSLEETEAHDPFVFTYVDKINFCIVIIYLFGEVKDQSYNLKYYKEIKKNYVQCFNRLSKINNCNCGSQIT
jgi:hypothetical protein